MADRRYGRARLQSPVLVLRVLWPPARTAGGERLATQICLHADFASPPSIGDLVWLVLITDLLARYALLFLKASIALALPMSNQRRALPRSACVVRPSVAA